MEVTQVSVNDPIRLWQLACILDYPRGGLVTPDAVEEGRHPDAAPDIGAHPPARAPRRQHATLSSGGAADCAPSVIRVVCPPVHLNTIIMSRYQGYGRECF